MPKSTKKTLKPVDTRILKEVSNTPPSIRTKKNVQFSPPSKLSFIQNSTFQKKFNVFNDAGFNDESRLNQNVNANVNSAVLTNSQFYDNSSSHYVPNPVKTSSKYNPMPIMSEKVVSASSSFQLPLSGPSSSSSVPVLSFPKNTSTSAPMIAKDNDEVSPFNVICLLIFSKLALKQKISTLMLL